MQELTDAQINDMSAVDIMMYIAHWALRPENWDLDLALQAAIGAAPYCNHPMAPMANDVLAGG
jgi:hypothetical protein